ncbi:MAG TPA: D-alanyl-D-alanine carboxypeptidase, partial [Phycisphaerae bacterium]|nr:D-alanyl-D-alanine carboxypeptidase [Phycisphaerae bacterium]
MLSQRIAAVVEAFRAKTGAAVGVHAVRLADGKELASVHPSRPLIPASNQKVVTSAVALKRLGEDFRFRTVVAVEGDHLVITGDGDPSTGDPVLAARRGGTIYDEMDRWAAAVAAAGVTKLKGDVILRAGIFAPPMTHPDWPAGDRRKWYGAGVAGVNFNDNCVDVSFTVAGEGVQADVRPASRWLRVVNRVRAGGKHLWDCRFGRSGTEITLTGTASQSSTEPFSVAAPDPPMLFA